MLEQLDLYMLAWKYEFEAYLARSTHRVKKELGLNPDYSDVTVAVNRSRDLSPLFVSKVVILGSVYSHIDDAAPDMGCFSSPSWKIFQAAPYIGLDDAKLAALSMMREIVALNEKAGYDGLEVYEGLFVPSGIVLRDQFEEPVAEFVNEKWIDETGLPSSSDREMLLKEVKRLRAEASFEGGWDNYETARQLREAADSLERKVLIAERLDRLVS